MLSIITSESQYILTKSGLSVLSRLRINRKAFKGPDTLGIFSAFFGSIVYNRAKLYKRQNFLNISVRVIIIPASILRKSTSGRHLPVSYPDIDLRRMLTGIDSCD